MRKSCSDRIGSQDSKNSTTLFGAVLQSEVSKHTSCSVTSLFFIAACLLLQCKEARLGRTHCGIEQVALSLKIKELQSFQSFIDLQTFHSRLLLALTTCAARLLVRFASLTVADLRFLFLHGQFHFL